MREALDLPPADADVVIADLTTRPVLGADDQERIRALIRACADGRLRALLILARSDIADLVDGIDGGVVPTIVTVSQLRLSDEELSQLLPFPSRTGAADPEALRQLTGGWLRLAPPALAALTRERPEPVADIRRGIDLLLRSDVDAIADVVGTCEMAVLCSYDRWDVEVLQLADPAYDVVAARQLLDRAESAGFLWREAPEGLTWYVVEPIARAFRRLVGDGDYGPVMDLIRGRLAEGFVERHRLADGVRLVEQHPDAALVWTLLQAAFNDGRWDLLVRLGDAAAGRPREWFVGPVDFYVLVTLINLGRGGRYVEWVEALASAAPVLEESGDRSLLHLLATTACLRAIGDIQRSAFYARLAVQAIRTTGANRPAGAEALTLNTTYLSLILVGDVETATWRSSEHAPRSRGSATATRPRRWTRSNSSPTR